MAVEKPIPKENNKTPKPEAKAPSLKFLPTVITSHIARQRLEQMKSDIDSVKRMNPTRFFPKTPEVMDPNLKK